MSWNKKGALLTLAVVVLWAALPASVCLFSGSLHGQHDCCNAMAAMPGMQEIGANSSCCQIHERTPAVVSVQLYSPNQSRQIAALPASINFYQPAIQGSGHRNAVTFPPPKFPPGGAIALRI